MANKLRVKSVLHWFQWLGRITIFAISRRYVLQRALRVQTGKDHPHRHRFRTAREIGNDFIFGERAERGLINAFDKGLGFERIPRLGEREDGEIHEGQVLVFDNLGALMGPVVHETSNFLNGLLLHVALLESTVPVEARADLEDIRRQGAKLGAIMRLLQQRRQPRDTGKPVDWNEIIRANAVDCKLSLASDLPQVPGPPEEVDRFVRFLLPAAKATAISTRKDGAFALCELECAVDIAGLIESRSIEPECEHALEIAACQAIVRRRGGTLRADNGVVVVTLPLASTNDGRG